MAVKKVTKKRAAKKAFAKKSAVKKPAAKKASAKKAVANKSAAKKTVAKPPVAKMTVRQRIPAATTQPKARGVVPPRRFFRSLDAYEEDAAAADRAQMLATARKRTTAAPDATRAKRAGRARSTAADMARPTGSFDPRAGVTRLIGPIADQPAGDESCTAYATVAAMQAVVARVHGSVAAVPLLSADHLFDSGGQQQTLEPVADAANRGVLETVCFPVACTDPSAHTWSADMQVFQFQRDRVAEICAALERRELIVISVQVFANFPGFRGTGIYVARGERIGAHALCIIGYEVNTGKGCWLVQNSFGTAWGESGVGRIAWEDTTLKPERVVYHVSGVQPPRSA